MRLNGATRRECLWIEIQHNRPPLQRLIEVEGVSLASQNGLRGEVGCPCSSFQRGKCRRGGEQKRECQCDALHKASFQLGTAR